MSGVKATSWQDADQKVRAICAAGAESTRCNLNFTCIALEVEIRQTKGGKDYLYMKLEDGQGMIKDVRFWNCGKLQNLTELKEDAEVQVKHATGKLYNNYVNYSVNSVKALIKIMPKQNDEVVRAVQAAVSTLPSYNEAVSDLPPAYDDEAPPTYDAFMSSQAYVSSSQMSNPATPVKPTKKAKSTRDSSFSSSSSSSDAPTGSLKTWKKPQLVAECKKQGIMSTGTRDKMISRLLFSLDDLPSGWQTHNKEALQGYCKQAGIDTTLLSTKAVLIQAINLRSQHTYKSKRRKTNP